MAAENHRRRKGSVGPRRTRSSIVRLFPNLTLVEVLNLLILEPEKAFYQREIAERTFSTLLQVQRALQRIEEAGMVVKQRRGNRVYYVADRRHPAFEDLKKLLLKTAALGDYLRESLATLEGRVRLAFVFGSVASGKEAADSDIDLLVVGDLRSREVIGMLGPLARRLGREFNPVVYKEREFRTKAKNGHHFITALISSPKIWLVGSDSELAQMVG